MQGLLIALVCLLVPLLGAQDCVVVEGPWVRARDLSSVGQVWASMAPEQTLFPAPRPGVRRFLQPAELQRLSGDTAAAPEPTATLCVERAARALTPEQMLPAIEDAWLRAGGTAGAAIEILDHAKILVPEGEIEFGRMPSASPGGCHDGNTVVWRGRLKYDGNQSIPIWASVRIASRSTMLAYQRDLPAGSIIADGDIASKDHDCLLPPAGQLVEASQAIGRRLKNPVRRGDIVRVTQLGLIRDVDRGEVVAVSIPGLDSVQIRALALTGGRLGELVVLQNPVTHGRFQAKVTGRRAALAIQEGSDELRR
jgi:flagella basal body P-ring formation protein FlgA